MLNALLRKPAIWWANHRNKRSDRPDHSHRWIVTREGKLLLDGRDNTPISPMSKAQLEAALQRFFDKIEASGLPISLEVIYIEQHIATGLWNEGAITEDHLKSSDGRYRGITFEIQLLGEMRLVSIQNATYYSDYEFIVEGHPTLVHVRDTTDFLGAMTGDPAF